MEKIKTLSDEQLIQLKFKEIQKQLNIAFPNSYLIKINFITSLDNNEMTIKLKFIKSTTMNNQFMAINFLITIDCFYPESSPLVKCMTNFVTPTLFDGRNLLFSILSKNWIRDFTIIDIINRIPEFISRVVENFNKKILIYYGEYHIDKVYDINDIIKNRELFFYKISQIQRKNKRSFSKERYIVLTDIYFLLFDPISDSKNYARLIFWGDIRQIKKEKKTSLPLNSKILEWKNEETKIVINFEISFKNIMEMHEFYRNSAIIIGMLTDNFKIFIEDFSKSYPNDYQNMSIDNLELLIKYKEDLFQKYNYDGLVEEIISLYKKIIEMLSANNNDSFTLYLDKLHIFLKIQIVENIFEAHSKNSKLPQNKFEMSHNGLIDSKNIIENYFSEKK